MCRSLKVFAWISFGCRGYVISFGLDSRKAPKAISGVACEVVFNLSDFKTVREGFCCILTC